MRRCCTAARRSSTRASRSARPTPAPSGASSPSTACVAMFTAPTAFRAIKKEDPKGKLIAQYDLSKFRTLFLAGERADPDTIEWAENLLKSAGDRSLVADRDRLGDRRQSGRARPAAGQARLADRADAGLRRARGRRGSAARSRPTQMGSIVVKLPLPPACLPTLWHARRALPRELPRRVPRLLQDRRRRLHRRGRLSSTSWAAPTTSSTSPATGSRPAAWRRCCPRTRTSPNAR